MARIFSILKTGNHRLCRPNLPSELGLSQSSILPHLADEKSQVNLLQRPREVLTVGGTLASALADKFLVSVASDGLLHKPNNASMRAAALSSSESTNSRAGNRPLGNSTYSMVNSPLNCLALDYRIIAIWRQRVPRESSVRALALLSRESRCRTLGPQITRGKSVQQGFTRASGGLLLGADDVCAWIAELGGNLGASAPRCATQR